MSKIEVNAIEPQCGTTLTVGAAGTTVTVPSNVVKSNALQASDAGNIISQSGTAITLGATGDSINLASGATQSGFGRTGTVDWDTTPKTATFSAVSGNGYFCNTSGGAFTVNLPAGSAGAIVSLADYTRTFQTNNLTIAPNGSEKIGGVVGNLIASTEGQSITLVYVDGTEGWINTAESTGQAGLVPAYITATGGTITCSGDYKIHTFTGPGTFTVCSVGNLAGSETVDYLVVAGGGGGGYGRGGGGGAGGARMSSGIASGCYTASPLGACVSALPVTVTGYPITVGSSGSGSCGPAPRYGAAGSNSVFSTITSAGGGGGNGENQTTNSVMNGGSGGGGARECSTGTPGGTGNSPPVSPSQGNNGGVSIPGSAGAGGGGGGAAAVGSAASSLGCGGAGGTGGTGITNAITGSSVGYAGGGGGGNSDGAPPSNLPNAPSVGGGGIGGTGVCSPANATATTGATNTGGGGGGGGHQSQPTCVYYVGANGGSGIIIIRYKFQ